MSFDNLTWKFLKGDRDVFIKTELRLSAGKAMTFRKVSTTKKYFILTNKNSM
jgi:hypothetical protein